MSRFAVVAGSIDTETPELAMKMKQKHPKYSQQTRQRAAVLQHLQNLEADVIRQTFLLRRSHIPAAGEEPANVPGWRTRGGWRRRSPVATVSSLHHHSIRNEDFHLFYSWNLSFLKGKEKSSIINRPTENSKCWLNDSNYSVHTSEAALV